MKFGIKKLIDDAKMPVRKTIGAAGYDLFSAEQFFLAPGERKLVSTGIALDMPPGWAALVLPRSGLAWNNGITVLNAPGLIDNDYTGEVKVMLINQGTESSPPFFWGDRVAQLVFTPIAAPQLYEVDEVRKTERGDGGFGSTGV